MSDKHDVANWSFTPPINGIAAGPPPDPMMVDGRCSVLTERGTVTWSVPTSLDNITRNRLDDTHSQSLNDSIHYGAAAMKRKRMCQYRLPISVHPSTPPTRPQQDVGRQDSSHVCMRCPNTRGNCFNTNSSAALSYQKHRGPELRTCCSLKAHCMLHSIELRCRLAGLFQLQWQQLSTMQSGHRQRFRQSV